MRINDLARLSTRMFKARTSRTLLTILGMGIGIAAILFLVSLGYGIQNALLEAITTTDSLISIDAYPQKTETGEAGAVSPDQVESMKNIEGVSLASPVFNANAQVQYGDLTSNSQLMVIDDQFFTLNGTKMSQGDALGADPGEAVISSTVATIFNKDPKDLVGESIGLAVSVSDEGSGGKTELAQIRKPLKIVGVIEGNDPVVYTGQNSIQDDFPVTAYSWVKVKCLSSNFMASVRSALVSQGYTVSSVADVVDQANKVFAVTRIILGFFGIIALIVSAVGMFNTMTVTLLERTEEIGVMKSIGAYDRNILSMFVFESTVMGFLGGIAGIIMGYIGGELFNMAVNILAKNFGGSSVTLFYSPLWFVGFILVSATVVGFFTGLIPAKRASSIDPLDALRYK